MPLIHIYFQEGKSTDNIKQIGDGIHQALMETWKIPERDRFQIFHPIKPGHFQMDDQMWDVKRSDELVVIHITSSPRTKQMKLDFYARLPEILHKRTGLRPEDVFVSIITNEKEDWSFGNGKAQLLE